MSWRTLCFILGMLCVIQTWRACRRSAPGHAATTTRGECSQTHAGTSSTTPSTRSVNGEDDGEPPPPGVAGGDTNGFRVNGFNLQVPTWAMWLAPHPGENLLDYRDRIVPIAQAAIAPQRARVARGREDFAKRVGLDSTQRTALDGAVREAQTAIQDKVMGSLMAGDLMPATFKPMTGVTLARDVLDTIDRANSRFVATLREDQRAALAAHPFDFADYLLFSARWEDALGVTN